MQEQKIRTYKELIRIPTFKERYEYLKLNGQVGKDTFGFDRYLNQKFYRSSEWKAIRNRVIIRDAGCDLGIKDREIYGKILIHHMNPITIKDITNKTDLLLNPDYLICTSKLTHDAIHYGDQNLFASESAERKPFDTCPWR